MKPGVVIDTNVPILANKVAKHPCPECCRRCVDALVDAKANKVVVIDEGGLVLKEYRRHLRPSGQPGLGDVFFRWLWDRQADTRHCLRSPITADSTLGFREFPRDPALKNFDQSDRKFVAVALASKIAPPIMNATDSDWSIHSAALKNNGITVIELCDDYLEQPHDGNHQS